jgi:hypothetical protein
LRGPPAVRCRSHRTPPKRALSPRSPAHVRRSGLVRTRGVRLLSPLGPTPPCPRDAVLAPQSCSDDADLLLGRNRRRVRR